MISETLDLIPSGIVKFFLVALFSFLIGLEQRRHHINEEAQSLFGTDRTFTLIGILGFILYVVSPNDLIPFLWGGVSIVLLLSIFYYQKIQVKKRFGATTLIIAIITYCLAPLVYTQPDWMVILVIVFILILTEIKETLFEFSKKFDNDEFITLAKFLVIAFVIFPLLPDKPISSELAISPAKFWLSIVAVSCISYFSYLLKKFVFPDSGIILTGILGGLYSSTATTIILAKKSKELQETDKVVAAMILATAMMYLRIFLLALFFNLPLALFLAPYVAISILVSACISIYFLKFTGSQIQQPKVTGFQAHNNPLEFKTALVFAFLFIFFGATTGYVNHHYGETGINVLSLVVGVTDIDPFILNLFQGKWTMANSVLAMAVLNAISSNNLLKMIYGLSFGSRSIRLPLMIGFGILIIGGLVMALILRA